MVTRFVPIQEGHAWYVHDAANKVTWPVPAYADQASAGSMCDIHNATEDDEPLAEKERLRSRHDETRKFATSGVSSDGQ